MPNRAYGAAPAGLELNPRFDPTSIYASIKDIGYDIAPGTGDYLAGKRAIEAYGNAGQAFKEMDLLQGLGHSAEGLAEQLTMIPGLGELAGAAKGVMGLAGTMIGRQGMTRLDPAREIRAKGASNLENWDTAQAYTGAEGKMRFEISDWDAQVDVDKLTPYFTRGEMDKINQLQDVFKHDEFFKAYPNFDPIVHSLRMPSKSMLASYDEQSNVITLNISALKDEAKETGLSMQDVFKRTLLHENQHGVQGIEGFARGGNSNEPIYRKLAGEQEAYMVGGPRSDLLPEFSKKLPPFDTSKPFAMQLPLSEQKVRLQPGGPVSATKGLMDPKVKAVRAELEWANFGENVSTTRAYDNPRGSDKAFMARNRDGSIRTWGKTPEEAKAKFVKEWKEKRFND